MPLRAATQAAAASASSKLTKPKPFGLPSSSVVSTWLVTFPKAEHILSRASSSVPSGRFLRKTLVNLASPPSGLESRFTKWPTKTFLPSRSMPLTFSMAASAASAFSKWTKPYPFDWPAASTATLADRMSPNAENVSCSALWSMSLSRFLMKTLPTPERRPAGSRCDHMMRMGRPARGW